MLIDKVGLSEPIKFKTFQMPFQATAAIIVPEGVDCSYSLVWSLDGQKWFPEPDIPEGTMQSAATSLSLCRMIALQVERISGGSIELQALQSGDT